MRSSQIIGRSDALIEARRCLGCYDAPCVQACPAQVNIPSFIARLREDNFEGAGELVYQANPLSSTCGIACPTSVLCEGACTLIKMGQTPVRIGSLHSFAARQYKVPEKSNNTSVNASIAVIGGGPSGLGCAVALNRIGYTVHLYDKSNVPGGLVNRVIPAYRLPKEIVDVDIERFLKMDINFHCGEVVDGILLKSLINSNDAVFIAIGLNKIVSSDIPGSDLSQVISALDFLDDARKYALGISPLPDLGDRVVVVGGGNVALDAAVMAKKLGSQSVFVIYRRSKLEMPGWESEYLEACSLGVEFRWLSTITDIKSNGNTGLILEVQLMRFSSTGSDGRRWVESLPGMTYQMICDNVIMALGQSLDQSLIKSLNLSTTQKGTIKVDPHSYQTSNPKVFAAGESVSGGSTIVESMTEGMRAGQSIHKWLSQNRGAV